MTRTVFCRKYQKELPGLDVPPYPGAKGQEIFNTVSKQAWAEWLENQTMLINEHRLNVVDPGAREFLAVEMEKFLSGKDFAKAEGYIPPAE